ncbi:hypothetical protein Syun_018716 [Stephania yunnanensis]|uniref:Uncharacterized protein n=1 Tax=Stephania yunnanensis TaxID=152371 RepID=A0AAP0ISX0_9MAGN
MDFHNKKLLSFNLIDTIWLRELPKGVIIDVWFAEELDTFGEERPEASMVISEFAAPEYQQW